MKLVPGAKDQYLRPATAWQGIRLISNREECFGAHALA